jgi:hypothetical protein
LLLQFYDLELHHLALLGILHTAAFVTLNEAYMGIEPHFDLWNYFFLARLLSAQMWKQWCGAVGTSLSDLGRESIHTSAF